MTFESVVERFAAHRNGSAWMAMCPAHEDAKASLSLGTGADGRVLLNCFAGCDYDAILGAVGLTASDLFNDEPKRPTNGCAGAVSSAAAIYPYLALGSGARLRKLRGADKTFTWEHKSGDDWAPKLDGCKPGLYRVGDLTGDSAWIGEGEKDTDRAIAGGLPCVCGPHGANTWSTAHTQQLVAAGIVRAIVVPHNDTPGLAYADRVAASLTAAGLAVQIVRLPGVPDHGGDLSDYFNAAHGRAELEALAAAAPAWTPGAGARADAAGNGPEGEPLPWARRLPDLIADVAHAQDVLPLISGFVLAGLITLVHGQPRDWKTIVALHVAIAVTTGRALFGLARLSVPVARSVLYLTEEDGARRVTERLRMICAGLGCAPPDNLFVAAGSGFSLDDPDSQARLIAFVRAEDIALVIPDPLRSLSGCVDQGPKELRPLTLTLRSLMRETGCTIFAVHHDSKPLVVGVDGRRRPQRASGGGVFSIADSPIGVDALPDGRRLLSPTAWKFSDDPPAIVLAIESGDGFLRLVGSEANGATSAGEADLAGRVLTYLATNPRTSGRAITLAMKSRKSDVAACLGRLAGIGKIDSVQVGRSVLWFATDENSREPCGNHRNEHGFEADQMVPDTGTIARALAENTGVSMVPEVGNHAEPYPRMVPAIGGDPTYGSRSYKGTIVGNHATTAAADRGDDAGTF